LSFEKEIGLILRQLVRVRDDEISSIPTVLFANKCDMENSRQITTDEGKDMAKKLGSNFFEGSARNNINIEAAFFDMVRAIRLNRNGTRKVGGEGVDDNKAKTPVKDGKRSKQSCALF
jgi:GTPase KRas protein